MNLKTRSLIIVILLVVSAIGLLVLFTQGGSRTMAPATDAAAGPKVTSPPGEPSLTPTSAAAATAPPDSTPQPAPEDDVPMVRVPAGEFIMGTAGEEIPHWERMRCFGSHCGYTDYVRDEWPQMTVYLDEFEIDQVEVTYARYARCVEAGACSPPRELAPSSEHPVLVKWADANAYCQWVGKRLPTEAEWEKAARGTDGRIYPWGDEWDPSRLKVHWVTGEGFTTVSVGSYPQGASPYGALDMAGNAPEWVSDLYQVYPGGRYTETSIWISGPFVRRGGYRGSIVGSADPPELHYRVADRFIGDDRAWSGFRCVRGPEPPSLEESIVSTEHYTQPAPLAEVDLTGMVEIPAGEFQMGSDDSDLYPAHTVYLDTFYIDRYETTHAEYIEFLNALGATYYACNSVTCITLRPPDEDMLLYGYPSHILKVDGRFVVEEGYEDYPAVTVSWEGANAYCRWRGKRLPTDAEWEKAARGEDGLAYPWGEQKSFPPCLSRSEEPVGSCPDDVSPYGVWDVAGGMGEWVSGWYDHDYYKDIPYDNPTGYEQPAEGYDRVYRPSTHPLYERYLSKGGPSLDSGVRCAYTP